MKLYVLNIDRNGRYFRGSGKLQVPWRYIRQVAVVHPVTYIMSEFSTTETVGEPVVLRQRGPGYDFWRTADHREFYAVHFKKPQ